ncbi:MAG: PEGA domain-containing protein [Deltaproteobacteria bacterium]|nr:PEGA domain-containing protein [Deltaproteobacteria bacterium]
MLAALLIPLLSVADTKPRLAVMPPQANRVQPDTAKAAEQLVLNALSSMGTFTVIGSSDISAILGFERMKDSLGCSDVSCAVEIAGALGANRLLTVTLSALGEQLIVTMTLIDPERGAVESRSQANVQNEERRYARAVEDALYGLFGQVPPTTSLEVLSTPAGADVLVDDVAIGRTPAYVGRIAPGPHTIRVLLAGYAEQKRTIALAAQKPHAEHVALADQKVERARVEQDVRAQIDTANRRRGRAWIVAALGIMAGICTGIGVPLLASAPSQAAIAAKEYRAYLGAVSEDDADARYRDLRRAVDRSNTQRGFGIGVIVVGAGFGIGTLVVGLTIPKAPVQVGAAVTGEGAALSLRGSF